MTEKEALIRVKTGNFSNGFGFDSQLLIDTAGTLGEMFRNGQISEVVRCKDCWKRKYDNCPFYEYSMVVQDDDFFCADGERR